MCMGRGKHCGSWGKSPLNGFSGGCRELADCAESHTPLSAQVVSGDAVEDLERFGQRLSEQPGSLVVIHVCASFRLRNDRIHDPELEAMRSVRLERCSRLPRLARVTPEDRRPAPGGGD